MSIVSFLFGFAVGITATIVGMVMYMLYGDKTKRRLK